MKILLFDPIAGASGDMILAALIDCGVSQALLRRKLSFVPGSTLHTSLVRASGVRARRVRFATKQQIKEDRFIPLINKSPLPAQIKKSARAIIERIFETEKIVHGTKHLHLHELADADTLLDIVGALVAMDELGVEKIYSRPLKAGQGFIRTTEGTMPAFNFATARLLKGFPVDFLPVAAEVTTPTGAAIISTLAQPATTLSLTRIQAIGLGAGNMKLPGYPNFMRIFVGESSSLLSEKCTIIETNIDDMNPQDYDHVFDRLYRSGAREVFLTPVIMKGSRPGVVLTVLAKNNVDELISLLLNETTTLGVRISTVHRQILPRRIKRISTPYGVINVKIAPLGNTEKYSFEYRDLKRIAHQHDIPLPLLRQKLAAFLRKMTPRMGAE